MITWLWRPGESEILGPYEILSERVNSWQTTASRAQQAATDPGTKVFLVIKAIGLPS